MTPKQEMFVKEYLIDLNATQAAIRAGYSEKTAQGYYVYFLSNPNDGSIFYIGKGKGKRLNQHVKNCKAGKIDNAPKAAAIKCILESGREVKETIFECGLSESEAYALERKLIHSLRDHGLTNISNGCMSNAELIPMQAQTLLDRLIPFNQWSSNLDDYTRQLTLRVFGSLEYAYNNIKANLESLVVKKC